ncbi:MAG TPA: heparinase II/III family protein [Propionibacteriaceae bacterium]|nr:heparinase II/III family protein [Propionibacteriaceae bacterium]
MTADTSESLPATAADSLGVPPATDRAAWDAVPAALVDPIVGEARKALDEPWPTLPASEYVLFHRTGDRHTYERRIWARRDRLTRATIAAARTLDPELLDDVVDGVWAWCEQSSWSWPAHDDRGGRLDDHLPDVDQPYLDLGAGEAVAQLALVDHILGPQLDASAPGIRRRIRREATTRVFAPLAERRDWQWLNPEEGAHNWNPWIHGNVLTAAIALLEGDELDDVVALVREGLAYFLRDLPDDGAIDEGYSYWWNGALRAVEASDLLLRHTGGAVDLAHEHPGLRATLDFPRALFLGSGSSGPDGAITSDWVVNAADGSALDKDPLPWHSLYRAASRQGRDEVARFAVAHRTASPRPAMGLGRLAAHLCDPEWLAAPVEPFTLARDTWFDSIQTLVARERPGTSSGLTVAVKAGHNGEHHNHNDVGSLIVALDGTPVIVDPGRTTYTAQTFSPERYQAWALTSEWHSVPAVHGRPQQPGPGFAATEVRPSLGADADSPSSLSCDIAGAYGSEPPRWSRTVTLDRAEPAVRIDDTWSTDDPDPEPHLVRLVVWGQVDHLDEHDVTVRAPGAARAVRVTASGGGITVDHQHLDDPMLTRVWGDTLTRITVAVAPDAGEHHLVISPAPDEATARVLG